jgi:hypothetical protein
MEPQRAQRGGNYSFLNILRIDSFHPETPLPRRERVGVRGRKKEHLEFLTRYHPHPSLPHRGGGEKWSFRMETG